MTIASAPPRQNQFRKLWFSLTAFGLAIVTTALCRSAAGVSLGLFFGGVAFATFLVPPLVSGEQSLGQRLVMPALVTLGIALVWLTALGKTITFTQWLACTAALLTYAFALGGLCVLLATARVNLVIAAALVTVLALLWLTWPVWLSPVLAGAVGETLVTWLVPAHPLFAINAVLDQFETWDRHPLAYSRLTVLNQDVFYRMPAGVLWTTLAHGFVAVVAIALAWNVQRKRRREELNSSQT